MFLNDFLKYALCYFPSSRSFSLYCLPSPFPINALPTPHFSHFQPCNTCVIVAFSLELLPPLTFKILFFYSPGFCSSYKCN